MQIYQNKFFALTHDTGRSAIEMDWTQETGDMTADDFKASLSILADKTEEHRPANVLINVAQFRYTTTPEIGVWRDEVIVPRYVEAGVRKFAYLLGEHMPAPPPSDDDPVDGMATRFFKSRNDAEAWLVA